MVVGTRSGDDVVIVEGDETVRVPVDEKGYLTDWRDWTPAVASVMAEAEGVELTADHWLVLDLFRQDYPLDNAQADTDLFVFASKTTAD